MVATSSSNFIIKRHSLGSSAVCHEHFRSTFNLFGLCNVFFLKYIFFYQNLFFSQLQIYFSPFLVKSKKQQQPMTSWKSQKRKRIKKKKTKRKWKINKPKPFFPNYKDIFRTHVSIYAQDSLHSQSSTIIYFHIIKIKKQK